MPPTASTRMGQHFNLCKPLLLKHNMLTNVETSQSRKPSFSLFIKTGAWVDLSPPIQQHGSDRRWPFRHIVRRIPRLPSKPTQLVICVFFLRALHASSVFWNKRHQRLTNRQPGSKRRAPRFIFLRFHMRSHNVHAVLSRLSLKGSKLRSRVSLREWYLASCPILRKGFCDDDDDVDVQKFKIEEWYTFDFCWFLWAGTIWQGIVRDRNVVKRAR